MGGGGTSPVEPGCTGLQVSVTVSGKVSGPERYRTTLIVPVMKAWNWQ